MYFKNNEGKIIHTQKVICKLKKIKKKLVCMSSVSGFQEEKWWGYLLGEGVYYGQIFFCNYQPYLT